MLGLVAVAAADICAIGITEPVNGVEPLPVSVSATLYSPPAPADCHCPADRARASEARASGALAHLPRSHTKQQRCSVYAA